MSKLNDQMRLRHMLDAAKEIQAFVQEKSRSSLDSDRILTLALVKLVEVIGEAAARVSTDKQQELNSIPWRDVIGMRNRLVHAYFDINLDLLWDTAKVDIPFLIKLLESAGADQDI